MVLNKGANTESFETVHGLVFLEFLTTFKKYIDPFLETIRKHNQNISYY